MGEGLGRVGDAVEDDPAAERAAGQRDQPDLEQGARHELLAKRVCEEVEHQWWWAGRIPTWSLPGDLDDRPGVGLLQHLTVEYLVGPPKAICRLLRQSTASQRLACGEVVGGDDDPAPLGRQLRDQRLEAAARRARRAPRRARRAAAGCASCTRPAGDQHPLALAAGEVAERVVGARPRHADPLERLERPPRGRRGRAASTRAGAGGRPSGRRRVPRPGSRAGSARSGGRWPRGLRPRRVPRIGRSSPSSTRSRVVLPPPFGPSSATRRPASTSKVTSSIAGSRP